jgi:chemotaxis protein methyltransferase CheR
MSFGMETAGMNSTPNVSLAYGDVLRFSKLVRDVSGLHFIDSRIPNLERGVRQAFAASTCTNLDEYFHLLQSAEGVQAMECLINALTVGESHFFRNTSQFDALQNHVLPEIIERRQNLRSLRIWSAGCSNGEEPYSIAILLRELLPDVDKWSINILGTDINTESLDRARRGQYSEWAFREPRALELRSRFFHQRDNRFELTPEVRRMVTFSSLNLAGDNYPSYETNTMFLDLIFCCNVMIYFPFTVAQAVIRRFYDALSDGGWLVVADVEHTMTSFQQFQTENLPDTIMYRRLAPPVPSLFIPPPSPQRARGRHTGSLSMPKIPVVFQPAPRPSIVEANEVLKPDEIIHRARELLASGRQAEARELLLNMVNENPNNAPGCALLGQIYADCGDWDNARRWCLQAIQLDNLCLEAYYILGLVSRHQEDLDQALEMMKKVVYLERRHVLGHFVLADLYHAKGQLPQALKSLDNARRLLAKLPAQTLLPESGGVTVMRLNETIQIQQQQWSASASGTVAG